MARRKTHPDDLRIKTSLSERLKLIRNRLYGDRGGPEMARRLGLPVRTWYNYESGVTVPAEVALKFVELTGVNPVWLLKGGGEPFLPPTPAVAPPRSGLDGAGSVCGLLREALQRLESRVALPPPGPHDGRRIGPGIDDDDPPPPARAVDPRRVGAGPDEPYQCLVVAGDAMIPVVGDGAFVAYATRLEPLDALDGRLVVGRVENRPVVRWLQRSGGVVLLRAENPTAQPSMILVELDPEAADHRFRRVLWISTPH